MTTPSDGISGQTDQVACGRTRPECPNCDEKGEQAVIKSRADFDRYECNNLGCEVLLYLDRERNSRAEDTEEDRSIGESNRGGGQ